MPTVYLLDYVAGNVRSLVNAIEKLGYTIRWIKEPKDIDNADVSSKTSHSSGRHAEISVSKY
jgi:imidazoleglycerol phosphate synthase glutamine amidotransferase subunit HisH